MVSPTQELRELLEYSIGFEDVWMHGIYILVLVGILATIQAGRPVVGSLFTTFLIGVMLGRATAI